VNENVLPEVKSRLNSSLSGNNNSAAIDSAAIVRALGVKPGELGSDLVDVSNLHNAIYNNSMELATKPFNATLAARTLVQIELMREVDPPIRSLLLILMMH